MQHRDEPGNRHPAAGGDARAMPDDGGFTLIEVLVAIVIATILLIGLTLSLGNTLRAVREVRTLEQATALALEQVEFARSVAWVNLAMAEVAHPLDPLLLHPADRRIVGSAVELPTNELLVEDPADGWIDTYRTETLDSQDFDISTYITEVEPGLRRVVAVVDWTVDSADRQMSTTALISEVSAQ